MSSSGTDRAKRLGQTGVSVGLGSEFDGFEGALLGLEDATKMGAIPAGLRKRGFAEGDIAKIAGLNFLRVWNAVHARAAAR